MSGCNSCNKCYEQADGTIIKRGWRDNAFYYTMPDLSIVTAMPAGFVSTAEVDCSKFDIASTPPVPAQVLEVVDADGNQVDDQLVRLIDYSDGSTAWKDLKTGTEYASEADYLAAIGHTGGTTHTSEDTDYNERTVVVCDEGVDVVSTLIYRDGDITDVISNTVTTLAGAVHVLSGNEVSGPCSGTVSYDYEEACFRDPSSADNPTVSGYVQTTTNAITGLGSTKWFDSNDVELPKANYNKVGCC